MVFKVWDIEARKIVRTLKGHTEEIYSLDFSRNGRYIVSGSADKTMWIWDLQEQTSQMIYLNKDSQNFEQGITSISISPDSKLVAAGCMDTIVRIYDIDTVELVDTLQGHDNSVYSVSFTPDGRGLVTGSLDKQLKLWDITPILQNIANPPSATTQRRRYPVANCPCISFKGHNVSLGIISRRLRIDIIPMPIPPFRTSFCPLRLLLIAGGSSRDPKIAVLACGMPEMLTFNSPYRDIRIQVRDFICALSTPF